MASIAGLPVCLNPKTRSIQYGNTSLTMSDSNAALCANINRRASSPHHFGNSTSPTLLPFCRTPKLNPAIHVIILLLYMI